MGDPDGAYTCIAEDNERTWGMYAKALDAVPWRGGRIAVIGAGLMVAPRILAKWSFVEALDVYEIDEELVATLSDQYPSARWQFILGDWVETYPGHDYDLTLFDTGEALTSELAGRLSGHVISVV